MFAGIALLYLLTTLLPPTILDALVYHLALPKAYVRAHALVDAPGNIYSFFPQNTEMLFALGLMAHSHVPAHVFHLTFGLLTALRMQESNSNQ